eukprot:2367696-Rhodomonas_salina.3
MKRGARVWDAISFQLLPNRSVNPCGTYSMSAMPSQLEPAKKLDEGIAGSKECCLAREHAEHVARVWGKLEALHHPGSREHCLGRTLAWYIVRCQCLLVGCMTQGPGTRDYGLEVWQRAQAPVRSEGQGSQVQLQRFGRAVMSDP